MKNLRPHVFCLLTLPLLLFGLGSCGSAPAAESTAYTPVEVRLENVAPSKVQNAIKKYVEAKGEVIEALTEDSIKTYKVIHRNTDGSIVLTHSTVYTYRLEGTSLVLRSQRLLVDYAAGSPVSYELRTAPVLRQESDELKQIVASIGEQ